MSTQLPERYEMEQIPIPATTRERYVTGLYALNVPAPEGTTGDWHSVFQRAVDARNPRNVTLGGGPDGTNHLFGSWGVTEGRRRLESVGLYVPEELGEVFVANHMRAIADLLHTSVVEYREVRRLQGATADWIDTPEQREIVFNMARRIAEEFEDDAVVVESIRRWIDTESATSKETEEPCTATPT